MKRLIIVSFGLLGLIFFEMSGGSDFDPEATRLSRIEAPASEAGESAVKANADAVTTDEESVTRVDLNLTSIDEILPRRSGDRTRTTTTGLPTEDVVATDQDRPSIAFSGLLGNDTSFPLLDVDTGTSQPIRPNVTTAPLEITTTRLDVAVSPPIEGTADVRQVTGDRVNVRGGPGTEFSVVDSLPRGTEVEILQDPGNGWVQLRRVGGETIGWMADFLLSEG